LHKTLLSPGGLSISEVALSVEDVSVNTKVWNKVVFVVLVHISLKLLVSGGLCLEAFWEVSTVAHKTTL